MSAASLKLEAKLRPLGKQTATHPVFKETKVEQVMELDVCTLESGMSLQIGVEILLAKQLTGAPVVDARQRICGFLSLKDCLPFAQSLALENEELEDQLVVAHLMTQEAHFLRPEMTLDEALRAFLNQWFHVYPVIDADGRIIGTLSRSRLLSFICRR